MNTKFLKRKLVLAGVLEGEEYEEEKEHRRGTTLIELLGVMAIIAILAVIAIGGITSARDTANETNTQSDIRTYQLAIQQTLVQHPEIMKFTATKPANGVELLVGYINDQMEEQWKFEILTGATDSGGVAGSAIKRDSWGNPYGLYIYFDDKASTYTDRTGTPLNDSNSCVYIAVVSAGKNSTGGPVGITGDNYDANTRKLISASAMVNNSDGKDDIGSIIRILNGDIYPVSFGLDKTTLGRLRKIQWIYGVPTSTGGVNYDFETDTTKTATSAGSVDQYYDESAVSAASQQLFGSWS